MFTCIDQQDDVVYRSSIDPNGSVCVSEFHHLQDFYDNFRKTSKDSLEIFATTESDGLVEQITYIRPGTKIELIPRLTAICSAFRQKIDDTSCVVLSIGRDSARLGYFREGRLDTQKELRDLSLRGFWRKFLSSNDYLRSVIERRRAADPHVEDDSFRDLQNALKGSQEKRRGPIYWLDERYPAYYLNAIKESLEISFGGMGRPNHLILSDWSAFGGLPQFLQAEGYNVCFSAEFSFQDAVRGLALWALDQKQKPQDAFVDCIMCGKKNRVATTPSRKRLVCGACKKPLPPILFQQGKESLLKGEYDKAITCFEKVVKEDKSNRLFQALLLLASIKHYKSIQGYEKKVADIRGWNELAESEKSWVKEILTLAGKEYLEKEDIESAEENLDAAYKIDPSGEVSVLLAKAKKEKGDQALRTGELKQAESFYEQATVKDPKNQTYPGYLQQVKRLLEAQRAKNQKLRWVLLAAVVAVSLLLAAWFGRNETPTNGDAEAVTRNLRAKLRELEGNNARLQQDFVTKKQELEGQLSVKEGEIEKLKGQIAKEGEGQEQQWREEIERARRLALIEREARMRAEGELSQSRESLALLQEKIGRLEGELRRDEASQRPLAPGLYMVIRDTDLLREPRESSPLVTRVQRGTDVRVVSVVAGYWLRIQSRSGRPPGYIRRDDAIPVEPYNNLRRKVPVVVPPPPPSVKPPEPKNGRISDHIKIAKFDRERGEYANAFSELEKALSIDPTNKEVQDELAKTRKACLAEKKIGRAGLPC